MIKKKSTYSSGLVHIRKFNMYISGAAIAMGFYSLVLGYPILSMLMVIISSINLYEGLKND